MIHVEKNFENISSKKMSDKEIELLQTIITTFKEIKSVEGIILTPFIKHCEDHTKSSELNMNLILFVNKNSGNYDIVEAFIQKIKSRLNNCDSEISNINLYSFDINIFKAKKYFNFWKVALETSLVSSYIVYDKTGTLINWQKDLGSKLNTITCEYQELVKLDNIDVLHTGPTKTKK